ncbi:hypothetical protein DCAR_0727971 [Daucus carota subsp. sativus]|uniref:Uncharacterized protein n=1 Tax=Daucus carota subsp. sativus TaxID=79200 RepID=A0A161Y4C2_DAUCS|nr:PREDICTED: aquaporin AQPAn.G-like [Daucus carota subsp. sativus]WOH08530.1 hypothetical protein DCAR_0727971 [Daucus carota subsp. sativus]
MAAINGLAYEDEESSSEGIKIQPLSSATMPEQWKDDAGKNRTPLTFRDRLGIDDFYDLNVWRASIGEIFGTAVLVFAVDTIVISSVQTDTKTPNVLLSILVAIIVTILLLAIHPVSGGHINPIVSFSAGLVGLISMSRAAIYIAAQCIGAVLGALALKAVVSSSIENTFSLGGCTVTVVTPGPDGPITIGLETGQAFWLEVICSFVFLVASIWMAYDKRQKKELGQVIVFAIVGTVLGLLVFISTTVTAQKGYAGAGINPARCLGPAIVRGGHLWNSHWIYWVGPGISCVAFYIYTKIIPREHFQPADLQRHDFYNVVKAF